MVFRELSQKSWYTEVHSVIYESGYVSLEHLLLSRNPSRIGSGLFGQGQDQQECTPPWRQPRGKSEVNILQILPPGGSIWVRVDQINHLFAPVLSPGWRNTPPPLLSSSSLLSLQVLEGPWALSWVIQESTSLEHEHVSEEIESCTDFFRDRVGFDRRFRCRANLAHTVVSPLYSIPLI